VTLVSSSLRLFVFILDLLTAVVMFSITSNDVLCMLGGGTGMSFFVANVCSGSKYCHTLLETVGLRVPNRNFKTLDCLMSTSNAENLLPFYALRQMALAVIPKYGMDVRSWLMISYF